MSAAIAITLLFFGLLIAFSIIWGFWPYLAGIAVAFVILSFIFGRDDRIPPPNPNLPRRNFIGEIAETWSKAHRENVLRGRIEKEWDRQSGFGNPEDLR